MKEYNNNILEELSKIEYLIREGAVLSDRQKEEIRCVCNQILLSVE